MSQIRDDLCSLPSVGPATQEVLYNKGYHTYEDLARAKPFQLHQQCDIVLASSSQIIDGAIEELNPECPNCSSNEFRPSWTEIIKVQPTEIPEDSDLFCENCYWSGELDEV